MIGNGRTVVITREEWVCSYPVHSGDMCQVVAYMEARAHEASQDGSDVYVSADDENVIVWYEVKRGAP